MATLKITVQAEVDAEHRLLIRLPANFPVGPAHVKMELESLSANSKSGDPTANEVIIEPKEDGGLRYSLSDLAGLGADVWNGRDAQEYIDELRDEWDRESI